MVDFKFLNRNVKDVIYKELIVKGQPALQIELAKNDLNLYQCFAADEAGNRCPQTFGNYSLLRKHYYDHDNPPYFYRTFRIHKMCKYSLPSHEEKELNKLVQVQKEALLLNSSLLMKIRKNKVHFTKIKRKKDRERHELMLLRRSENIRYWKYS
jgi:hypothetical protein